MTDLKLFVTGHKGFETTHFHELRLILAETEAKLQRRYGGVEINGDLESVYRICLHSRTSNRVFCELAQFIASDENKLYQAVYQIDWSAHFTSRHSIAVSATLSRSSLDHSHYVSLKVKDAIVDQFREKLGSRPVIDKQQPDCHIHINIHQNQASISLDLSGESLHRRGYRLQHAGAPLKEHLAASMIINAGWNYESAKSHRFIDPMCGSGTFAIEAALIAANIAPGLDRDYFGFSKWLKHDQAIWRRCIDLAEAQIDSSVHPVIDASDYDPEALKISQANAARAGVEELIQFSQVDISQQQLQADERPAIVVSNPPYGERLKSEQGLAALYTNLGHCLRKIQSGRLYLISASPDLYHRLRLNRIFKKAVKNGPLDCVIAGFEFSAGASIKTPEPEKRKKVVDQSIQPLINRLKKNSKHVKRWANRNNVSCYRVYDADLPEFSFALDVYQSDITHDLCWYHLQEYQAPRTIDAEVAEKRIELAKEAVLHTFGIEESLLFCKTRQRQRGKKQYQKQDHQGELFRVREGDAVLLINLSDYLDSGLFLDHRITRYRVKKMAEGKSVLNLFCYTGSVSVQAMLGGANRVVNVDMSSNYLSWAKENHAINGFECGEQPVFIRANILELLQTPGRYDLERGFDIIFLDPPSFSNSSKMPEPLDIQRDHETLITDAMKLLNSQGVLIFSTNRRGFKLSDNLSGSMAITDISRDTIPEDFKRRPQIHKCWEIRHRA
ncbi:MAG: bifunctional 23S rRNA (guanine(2069)-N(7))-methyltransferase RlmK/23S rRNA (guanine(2445)-N(2))-methyltransferase RlmL [Gammaproteobacteria bacterium]|nr:bifunctional 23S rRNA (guanine(2069)-N(7))-methyltransferase RlmK/23S rRNA (guanine(2445)-N(2))-methyltransferase RlmL [Gammaproteobacteria bacterium]